MRTHASEKAGSQEDRVRGKGWGTVSKGKRSDDVPWTSRVTKRRPCLFSGIARTSARRINSIRRDITSFDRPIDRIPLFTFSSSSQASSGFRSDDAGQSNGRRSKLRRARLRTLVEKDVRRDEPTKFGVDHEIGMVPIRACFGSKMAKGEKKKRFQYDWTDPQVLTSSRRTHLRYLPTEFTTPSSSSSNPHHQKKKQNEISLSSKPLSYRSFVFPIHSFFRRGKDPTSFYPLFYPTPFSSHRSRNPNRKDGVLNVGKENEGKGETGRKKISSSSFPTWRNPTMDSLRS